MLKFEKPNYKVKEYIESDNYGKFEIESFSLNIDFRGSKNQRIIDVPRSLNENKVVLKQNFMKEHTHKIEVPRKKHIYI